MAMVIFSPVFMAINNLRDVCVIMKFGIHACLICVNAIESSKEAKIFDIYQHVRVDLI